MLVDLTGWKDLVDKKLLNYNKILSKNIIRQILLKKTSFSFLRKDNNEEIFSLLDNTKKKFSGYDQILLIGTGGSSLGAKAFLNTIQNKKIFILENIDPSNISSLLKNFSKIKKIGIIIISKSGETIETLSLFSIVIKNLKNKINLLKDVIIISDNKSSTLLRISKSLNIKTIHHDATIGGRYSCFSITGLLPIHLAGVNGKIIKARADKNFLDNLKSDKFNNQKAINILAGVIKEKKYFTHIFLIYSDVLSEIANWYRQLWSESLGKKGYGLYLMNSTGAIDQHSQLQMWLDGPKNIIFTVVIPRERSTSLKTNSFANILPKYFSNVDIGKILNIMGEATIKELKKAKIPVRIIYLDNDSINSAVTLMSTLLLEVSLIGKVIGINPFDQPEVEKIKLRTKKMLESYGRN